MRWNIIPERDYTPPGICDFDIGLLAAGGAGAGYTIANAARSNGASGLTLTPSGAGNRRKWTAMIYTSFLEIPAATAQVFGTNIGGSRSTVEHLTSGKLQFDWYNGSTQYAIVTDAVMRDLTGAFGLLTIQYDADNVTASNRTKLFWMTDELSVTGTYVPQFTDSYVNAVTAHGLFMSGALSDYFEGVGAEFRFFDGLLVDPTEVLKQDSATSNWVAKEYTGAYGSSGAACFLDFSDDSGAHTLGLDRSGNGNNWTVNGTITQVTSTPTNVFWAFNQLHEDRSGTLTNGNRTVTGTVHQVGTLAVSSGKYTWKVTDAGSGGSYGIELANGAQTETTYTASASDVLEFELDLNVGTLDVRVNGGGASSVATGLSGLYVPLCKAPCTVTADFTPTDNTFKTLCTDNLPARSPKTPSTPQTGTQTFNGTTDNAFINLGMAPDKTGSSTINGVAIVWGTNALACATGVKVISAAFTGTLNYSIAVAAYTGGSNIAEANAMSNP